jgi:DNA modification methylase
MANTLYYGDNLEILRKHIPDESIDLIYLDPPFNSNRDYNVIFKEASGEESEAQLRAFSDSWHWTSATQRTLEELAETAPSKLVDLINGFINVLGHNDVTAYLVMMTIRLVELHRALKPTGSLYLHCDPTASHYLKIVLDVIFEKTNFRNEIVWKRFTFHADAKRFGRVTDRILFYTKGSDFTFDRLRAPFSDEYIESKFTHVDPEGRRFRLDNLNPPGGRGPVYEFHGVTKAWRFTKERMRQLEAEGRIYTDSSIPQLKRYLDELEGQAIHELWADISPINPQAKERMGYPTQKPLAMLERIIQASSNEGDLVLDPFCGCGTTIIAAQRLRRRWIGIDITHLAISLMKYRLHDTFCDDAKYEVVGEPVDAESARALAEQDRYQFQWWALSLIKARPVGDEKKKGADEGIDGTLYFIDDAKTPPKKIVIQVKSGKVQVKEIRELIQVVHRAKATMGFFITLQEPTEPMLKEALTEGFYKSIGWGKQYEKIQIRTIAQLLNGETLEYPSPNVTFKKAERVEEKAGKEEALDL